MMNKFLLIIMTLLSTCQLAWSQAYEVESLELNVKDLTARTQSRVDANGRKCGILKIYVNDEIHEVRGNIIGDIKVSGLEKMVYFTHDTKQLELIFRNHIPLNIIFRDYGFPTLSGEMTYVMKLKDKRSSSGEITVASNQNQIPDDVERIRDEIKKAYDGQRYEKAMSLCKTIPEDTYAQFYMAYMYDNGKKASKAARETVKSYSKQGWKSAPRALPLEKQLDNVFMMEGGYVGDGLPQFWTARGSSTGGNYDAAKMQALELAKQVLEGNIQSDIIELIKKAVANEQMDKSEAASITRSVFDAKNLISQSIGRVPPMVEFSRVVNGNNWEVHLIIAYSQEMAKAAVQKAVKKDLEERGGSLHNKLGELLGW